MVKVIEGEEKRELLETLRLKHISQVQVELDNPDNQGDYRRSLEARLQELRRV